MGEKLIALRKRPTEDSENISISAYYLINKMIIHFVLASKRAFGAVYRGMLPGMCSAGPVQKFPGKKISNHLHRGGV
ncbi:hypothetical protein [Natronogracilivirga saccharolytica]|uniref:hypothetical protein n=1 Tax=Natronogracilivirga saccharolytica TaxID=2812953 RepID=UPI001B30CB73|nr:hypothetical protein [Natronogracilivirga saccharolytica]